MNNIFTKSIIFILFSLLLLSFTIFLINDYYNLNIFYLTLKYTSIELLGLVLILSQVIFVIREKINKPYNLVINTIICWIIYLFGKYFFNDKNIIYFFHKNFESIFVERAFIYYDKLNLLNNNLVIDFLLTIHRWDLDNEIPYSSFILLLLNISIFKYFRIIMKEKIVFRFLIFILLFIFYIYFWNILYNVPLFLISIFLLKRIGHYNEKY